MKKPPLVVRITRKLFGFPKLSQSEVDSIVRAKKIEIERLLFSLDKKIKAHDYQMKEIKKNIRDLKRQLGNKFDEYQTTSDYQALRADLNHHGNAYLLISEMRKAIYGKSHQINSVDDWNSIVPLLSNAVSIDENNPLFNDYLNELAKKSENLRNDLDNSKDNKNYENPFLKFLDQNSLKGHTFDVDKEIESILPLPDDIDVED